MFFFIFAGPLFISMPGVLFLAVYVIGFLTLVAYSGGVLGLLNDFAEFRKPDLKDFVKYVKQHFFASLIIWALNGFVLFIALNAIGFYTQEDRTSVLTPLIIGFLLWGMAVWFFSAQSFLPIYIRRERKLGKSLKRMFMFFLDNQLFCLFEFFFSFLMTLLSVLSLFIIPGIAGVALFQVEAYRLRRKKYEYLKRQGGDGAKRKKKIPWLALFKDDKEKMGHRTIKDVFLPGKMD